MRFLKYTVIGFLVLSASYASAQYNVTLTFVNGATRTLDGLVVQDKKIILANENLQVPFDQIQSADFTFDDPLTSEQCLTLLKNAAYEKLIKQIDAFLEPVGSAIALRGNLDVYLQYKMRASFWTEKYRDAALLAQLLKQKDSEYAPLAGMYEVLMMLEQGEPIEKVRSAFDKISSPENISGAMTEYIEGRLAAASRKDEGRPAEKSDLDAEALKHFSKVLVNYRRDPEWVPAATFYEAVLYERNGNYKAVSDIKKELRLAYSDGFWGRRANELD